MPPPVVARSELRSATAAGLPLFGHFALVTRAQTSGAGLTGGTNRAEGAKGYAVPLKPKIRSACPHAGDFPQRVLDTLKIGAPLPRSSTNGRSARSLESIWINIRRSPVDSNGRPVVRSGPTPRCPGTALIEAKWVEPITHGDCRR